MVSRASVFQLFPAHGIEGLKTDGFRLRVLQDCKGGERFGHVGMRKGAGFTLVTSNSKVTLYELKLQTSAAADFDQRSKIESSQFFANSTVLKVRKLGVRKVRCKFGSPRSSKVSRLEVGSWKVWTAGKFKGLKVWKIESLKLQGFSSTVCSPPSSES